MVSTHTAENTSGATFAYEFVYDIESEWRLESKLPLELRHSCRMIPACAENTHRISIQPRSIAPVHRQHRSVHKTCRIRAQPRNRLRHLFGFPDAVLR